jgi:hypothetical protein
MIDYLKKKSLSEFTKKEFLSFVTHIFNGEEKSEEADNIDVRHFDMLVPHPEKNGLIFWPPEGIETPEDIVNEIERYCKENNLPCFKD